jgi:hypothetical protein
MRHFGVKSSYMCTLKQDRHIYMDAWKTMTHGEVNYYKLGCHLAFGYAKNTR